MTATAQSPSSRFAAAAPTTPGARPQSELRRAPSGEQRLVIHNVSWQSYVEIGEALRDRNVFLTYDRGSLEIMTKGLRHEGFSELLTALIEAWIQVARLPVKRGGSTTFRREELEKGLEPDKCWWLAGEAVMRRVWDWDPAVHPPPDLALEVDITSSSIDRMGVYAAIGIPEVWRFDGTSLTFHARIADAKYEVAANSRWFPKLPAAEIVRFLAAADGTDQTTWLESFRAWASDRLKS